MINDEQKSYIINNNLWFQKRIGCFAKTGLGQNEHREERLQLRTSCRITAAVQLINSEAQQRA